MDWLGAAQQLRHDGQPGVLVTVIEVRGHAPREAGAKMVVSRDRSWGSVGGGNLEATAIARAREMISSGAAEPEISEMQLNPHARTEHGRQCCGGVVRLLLEPLAVPPVVALFGIGHVGYELARILSRMPIQLLLVDSRAEQLDRVRLADVIDGSADVSIHHTLLGEQILEQLPRGAHVVIMTHDHAEDFALCDAALRAGRPLGGIGLIGSAVKWTRFQAQLADMGHSPAAIARITCPIGLPGITGKDPATIAVAVAAELLEVMSEPEGRGAAWTSREPEGRGADWTSREPKGRGADWTSREPKGRGADWTSREPTGAVPPGLRSDEGATREGGTSRAPGGERESTASGKAERAT